MKRIALALVLAACPKERPSAPDAALARPLEAAPSEEEGFSLTPAMLEAYLKYQRAWVVGSGFDGGRAVDRAEREEAALKASGLSEGQLQKIDEMVAAVIARRMVSQLADDPRFTPDLSAMADSLGPEQRKRMEAAVAQFKAQQQAARELTEERRQFGSPNIDVLLTREAELTKMWSEMMGVGAYTGPNVPPVAPMPGVVKPGQPHVP